MNVKNVSVSGLVGGIVNFLLGWLFYGMLFKDSFPQPEETSKISKEKLRKLTAMIKETGFMVIPTESFPVREDVDEYQKSTIKVTLNGKTRQIHWPEQNATEKFIPPIITLVESELDQIINQLIE